jgi:hypothetical protein
MNVATSTHGVVGEATKFRTNVWEAILAEMQQGGRLHRPLLFVVAG